MKIAIIVSPKTTNIDVKKYIPANCTEILTNYPLISKYINDKHILCTETSIQDAVENADYVFVLCGKSSRGVASIASKCKKHEISFEMIMTE